MVHFWFAPTVGGLVTSPVMPGQEDCDWVPATGNSVARTAASESNRGELYFPLKILRTSEKKPLL